jgi:hypothetical protein
MPRFSARSSSSFAKISSLLREAGEACLLRLPPLEPAREAGDPRLLLGGVLVMDARAPPGPASSGMSTMPNLRLRPPPPLPPWVGVPGGDVGPFTPLGLGGGRRLGSVLARAWAEAGARARSPILCLTSARMMGWAGVVSKSSRRRGAWLAAV